MNMTSLKVLLILIAAHIIFIIGNKTTGQSASPTKPSFIVNLKGKAGSIWLSPNIVREEICCRLDFNANPPIRCNQFVANRWGEIIFYSEDIKNMGWKLYGKAHPQWSI